MRTKNSIKNIIFGMVGQAISILLSFVSRTVFIYILGTNYLGVNGLFSNILSMLSLAELGVGSAIIYNMYKPLANKDEGKLKSLMQLYSRAYRIIGTIVAIIGISIVPFLDFIIKDKPNISNLTLIYLLFLLNSVTSYFFIYKSSIIIADQKNYIITIKQQVFNLIQVTLQIIVLLLTKSYILYLIIQIICNFMLNLSISKKADEIYPFLKEKNIEGLDKKSQKDILKHVTAMMSHKVGGVVVNGTDNILISSFVGVYWVGIYSNYILITGMINRFLSQIFSAITASVGNLNAKESKEKAYEVYEKLLFLNFWIYGFCSICLGVLVNPFITFWLGKQFLMTNTAVLVITINFYLMGMRQTTITFNSTLGLFWNDRFKPWIEAAINIIISIILLNKFGIIGVFLGTLISTVTTSVWVDPYILYKYGFNKSIALYFIRYIKYILVTAIGGIITQLCVIMINYNGFIGLLIKGIICLIIPNIIFCIFFFYDKQFKNIKIIISQIVKERKK